jgi:succinate dehydrogenase/fumarate reductase flavoprotein subunit
MIYPPYPAEARLITATGEDLLDKHGLGDINQAIIRQRDAFSALIAEELRAGPVRMDLRPVPAARWKVHSLSLLARFGFDFATRPVRITPATHFCMGGVRTDTSGHTAVPGLFACGEMVWGLHGANRMGGNALMECLVSGRVAGRAAALLAVTNAGEGGGPLPQKPATPATDTTPVDLRALRQRIREVAWRSAGIVRTGEGMAQGLAEVEVIREALANAGADTAKERALREDLRSAAFTLCAILTASIGRLESRGCFKRADHPVEDDAAWRRNSRLSWDPLTERFSLEYRPAEAG